MTNARCIHTLHVVLGGSLQPRTSIHGPQRPGGLQVKDPLHTGRLDLQEDPSAVESGSQVTDGRDRGI